MAKNNNVDIELLAGLDVNSSEQEILAAIKILQGRLQGNNNAKIKLRADLDVKSVTQAINKLNNLLKNNKNITSPAQQAIIQLQGQLNSLAQTVNQTAKQVTTATQQAVSSAQKQVKSQPLQVDFQIRKEKLINDLKILGDENSRLFKNTELSAKYFQLMDNVKFANSTAEVRNLRLQMNALKSELKATGNAGLTLGDQLRKTFSKVLSFFGTYHFMSAFTTQMRNAWTEAKDLDSALTNLARVSADLTRSDFPDYLDKCIKKSKELAISTQDYISAVTTFSRAGYQLSDAEMLSEYTAILQRVGDMSDAEETAKGLLATIQAYDEISGYTTDNLEEKIIATLDRIDKIGNIASISQEELLNSVRSIGSIMNFTGTSLDETIALVASTNRSIADANKVSLGIRTSALRLRASSSDPEAIRELEEMGEATDDLAKSTADLREEILALTNVDGLGGVDILQENGEDFKSIYQIYSELSKVIDKMNGLDRSNLLEAISGKQRSNIVAAALNSMTEADKLLEESLNSAGTAQDEYSLYLESTAASIEKFGVAMTETYNNIINGNTVKAITDAGTATLEFANDWGIVEGTLRGIIAIGIAKFLGTMTTSIRASAVQLNSFGNALNLTKTLGTLNKNSVQYRSTLEALKQSTISLSEAQLRQVLSSKNLSTSQRVAILQSNGLSRAQATQKLNQLGLIQTTNAQTVATNTATASTFSLKNAVTALGYSIKSAFFSNPVGLAIVAITSAISIASGAISKHNQKIEESIQKTKEEAEKASELTDELSELTQKYISLSDAIGTDQSAKEDLLEVQEKLLKKLGLEGESVDNLIQKYGDLDSALKAITLQELKDAELDLIANVSVAEETLMDAGKAQEKWYNPTSRNIISGGKDAVPYIKKLVENGLIEQGSYGPNGGSLILTGDDSVNGALENFNKLQEALRILQDNFTATELKDSDFYQSIYSRSNAMKDEVEAYNTSIKDLNANLAQQYAIQALQGNALPQTKEEFESFREDLIATANASEKFIGTESNIDSSIDSYLSGVQQFSSYYTDQIQEELDKVAEKVTTTTTTTLAGALTKLVDEDNKSLIDAYTDKVNNLEKYLTKLQDGTYTASDIIDLANDFGIAGDSIDSLSNQIKSMIGSGYDNLHKNIIAIISDAGTSENVKDALRVVDSELKKLSVDAKNCRTALDQLTDAKDITAKLDNVFSEILDKGYATIDSLSSLPDAIKNVDGFDAFAEILGDPNKSIEDHKKALDALLQKYYFTTDALNSLTRDNADMYAKNLEDAGIKNAKEMIDSYLDFSEASDALSYSLHNVTEETKDETVAQLKEAGATEEVAQELTNKAIAVNRVKDKIKENTAATVDEIQQYISEENAISDTNLVLDDLFNLHEKLNNNSLDFTNDIEQIIALANATGTSVMQLKNMQEIISQLEGGNLSIEDEQRKEKIFSHKMESESGRNAFKALTGYEWEKLNPEDFVVKPNKSKTGDSASKSDASLDTIDWIETEIARLESAISEHEENGANTVKTIEERANAYQEASNAIAEEIRVENQAYKRYKQEADAVSLDLDTKRLVEAGAIDISKYSDEKASLIKEYQEWYEKSLDAQNSINNLTEQQRKDQKAINQLYIDEANSYQSMIESQSKNEAYGKNRVQFYKEEGKWIKQSYDYQIKNAKLEKNAALVAQLEAEKKKAILDNMIKQYNALQEDSERSASMYSAKSENAISSGKKNYYIDQQMKYVEESYENQIKAVDTLEEKETLRLQKLKEIGDLAKQEFDNIKDEYEWKQSLIDVDVQHYDDLISLAEASGSKATSVYYHAIDKQQRNSLDKYEKELVSLENELAEKLTSGEIKEGSAQWQSMMSDIYDTKASIDDLNISLQETSNTLREIRWNRYDDYLEEIGRKQNEVNFMLDLLNEDKFFDEDTGAFTEYGQTARGLHTLNYESYTKEAQSLKNAIKEDMENYEATGDEEWLVRYIENVERYQEVVKGARSEWEAIGELLKQQFEQLQNALSKVVSEYESALDAASDLKDYQKSISDKTKELQNLQLQYQALSGDDSDAGVARLQKLSERITDAQEDLEETQYDRWKSDQKKMLGNLTGELENYIDRLDIDSLIDKEIEKANENKEDICNTLKEVMGERGYQVQYLNGVFDNDGSWGKSVREDLKALKSSIDAKYVASGVDTNKVTTQTNEEVGTKTASAQADQAAVAKDKAIKTAQQNVEKAESAYNTQKIAVQKAEEALYLAQKGNANPAVIENLRRNLAQKEEMLDNAKKSLNKALEALDTAKYAKYAKGGKNITNDMIISQEKGGEYIIRKDGSVLTPMGNGNGKGFVLNNAQSEFLYDFTKAMTVGKTNLIDPSTVVKNSTSGDNNTSFLVNMYGVSDPDEFVRNLSEAMERPDFQKKLRSQTVDLLTGANSLSYKKYKMN